MNQMSDADLHAMTDNLRTKLHTRLHRLIDRADTWCLEHPRTPKLIRIPIARAWGLSTDKQARQRQIAVPSRWNKKGKPTTWMHFARTHPENPQCHNGCVIHHRTGHHMAHWQLHWRGDRGIFERICPHGIGHPDPDQYPYWRATDQMWQTVHGCDGCCRKENDDD